tara:strand:- start:684 stop:989 length:306 start_codon:yes stop_codon:yes gene_type:complete
MAAQSTTDVVFHWGQWNYGAPISTYVIVANGDVSAEVNHGEEMEQLSEALTLKGTWIGVSGHSNGGKTFTVSMENSSWTDATMQVAIRLIGGNLATATVNA